MKKCFYIQTKNVPEEDKAYMDSVLNKILSKSMLIYSDNKDNSLYKSNLKQSSVK